MNNKFLNITLLISSVIFSSTSYAEWTKLTTSTDGYVFYIDYESIRKKDGFSYYWSLVNFPTSNEDKELSAITLRQGDCGLFRYKLLTQSHYKKYMGNGNPSKSENYDNAKWKFAQPNSINYDALRLICNK